MFNILTVKLIVVWTDSQEDENYEKIKEIKEDNIETAKRQPKSRKKDDCNGYRA